MGQKKPAISTRKVAVVVVIGAAIVWLSNVFEESELAPSSPKSTSPLTSRAIPIMQPTEPKTFAMPDVIGKSGYDADKAVQLAAAYQVSTTFQEAIPIECTTASPIMSPIVRTDPPAGTEVLASDDTVVILFADLSAGATTCSTAPVAPPLDVGDVPDASLPNDSHAGCTYVDGYIRKDGVRVRGHWRC